MRDISHALYDPSYVRQPSAEATLPSAQNANEPVKPISLQRAYKRSASSRVGFIALVFGLGAINFHKAYLAVKKLSGMQPFSCLSYIHTI